MFTEEHRCLHGSQSKKTPEAPSEMYTQGRTKAL